MGSTTDPLIRLYQACSPNLSLGPADPRYVNCDDVRGGNLVSIIERSLRRADPAQPEKKLFAGHRGVGKTSELLRLKALLEKEDIEKNQKPFQVIYFDVSTSLDVNDLDFPDLLVCSAAEVQEQLREAQLPGYDNITSYFYRIWDDIKTALGSEVSLKEVEAEVPFGKLTLELRNRPNARQTLRNAIEVRSSSILQAVNDLLDQANLKLRATGRAGLVLVIDGLDKLIYRNLQNGSTNTHERLFFDRSEQLASLNSHTIYTVPISLFYNPRCHQLEQTFGQFNRPVSMINIRGEGRSAPTPSSPGMQKLWEMILNRCKFAEVDINEIFDNESTCSYLCRMCGGHPRHLMMFIQAALNEVEELPITRIAAERAIRDYGKSLSREIPDDFWPFLREFDQPKNEIAKNSLHQQMLFYLHIFEYDDANGQPWYEVNPVISTLPRFAGE